MEVNILIAHTSVHV